MLPSTAKLVKIKFIVRQPFSKVVSPRRFDMKKVILTASIALIPHSTTRPIRTPPVNLTSSQKRIRLSAIHNPENHRELRRLAAQFILPAPPIPPPHTPVLNILCTRCAAATNLHRITELPKHLLQRLDARKRAYTDADEPLPFLRLIEASHTPSQRERPQRNRANDVCARIFIPLIRYLLELGANPAAKDAIAMIVAPTQERFQTCAHPHGAAAQVFFEEAKDSG
ncbi:hypothetical protein BDZ89DRAFT_1133738 [Hymenopellis radicata]|nr:hypothetical protein BDZ89DRAFT_1133738 [Hymenopellis radicata]